MLSKNTSSTFYTHPVLGGCQNNSTSPDPLSAREGLACETKRRGVATVEPGRAQALTNQRVIPRGRTWSHAGWAPAYGVDWCVVSTTVSNGRRFPVLQPGSEEVRYVSIFTCIGIVLDKAECC